MNHVKQGRVTKRTSKRKVSLLLTPCFYKRGLIWLIFFVVSLVVVPLFTDHEPQITEQPKKANMQKLVPHTQGR